jgi:hypothetical protein
LQDYALENGANVDVEDNDGRTVFQIAQGKGEEIQKLLLECGAKGMA